MNSSLITFAIVFAIYLIGVIVAYVFAAFIVSKDMVSGRPALASVFSWFLILAFLVFLCWELLLGWFSSDSFKSTLNVLKYIYSPVYATGYMLYTVARMTLGVAYLLMLEHRKASDIFKYLFR